MTKPDLRGYWKSKTDPTITIYVEKVFKKGYVTGFSYKKTDFGTQHGAIHGRVKLTYGELEEGYHRG